MQFRFWTNQQSKESKLDNNASLRLCGPYHYKHFLNKLSNYRALKQQRIKKIKIFSFEPFVRLEISLVIQNAQLNFICRHCLRHSRSHRQRQNYCPKSRSEGKSSPKCVHTYLHIIKLFFMALPAFKDRCLCFSSSPPCDTDKDSLRHRGTFKRSRKITNIRKRNIREEKMFCENSPGCCNQSASIVNAKKPFSFIGQ